MAERRYFSEHDDTAGWLGYPRALHMASYEEVSGSKILQYQAFGAILRCRDS